MPKHRPKTNGQSSSIANDEVKYMCLRCRQIGHIFNDCPNPWFQEDWNHSQPRKELHFDDFADIQQEPLCQRCQDLDVLGFLAQELPWDSLPLLDDDTVRESGCLTTIGHVGTVLFRQDCSLCRCLYTMTPEPETPGDEILLFPGWTTFRLEGGISIDTPEKRSCARCVQVVLDPYPGQTLSTLSQRGDALCLLEEDRINDESNLGGRVVDPHAINHDMIQRWLSTCNSSHPITCATVWDEDLQTISLIHVPTRQIVKHPSARCGYLALSYVWGGVDQGHYRIGEVLEKLPQTIEDAITFTAKLGRDYLWVDSVCIDQSDEVEKHRQIRIMSLIYEGAEATIIAFSSQSADSGLLRISLDDSMIPQMKTIVGGKRLVGLGPTLSQSIWTSAWGQRAWTLQEALLSRRCIYLGSHQILFECNAMQCSESLDETRSWIHNVERDEGFVSQQSDELIGAGVLHSPFVSTPEENLRLQHYTVLANLYSYRTLTFDEDALNGFLGIIQYLSRLTYSEGFFWGLPVADLNWALGWNCQRRPERRGKFPSWSWAAWKCPLSECQPINVRKPHEYAVNFKAWKLEGRSLVPLLDLPKKRMDDDVGKLSTDLNSHLSLAPTTRPDFNISIIPRDVRKYCLIIRGHVLFFQSDFTDHRLIAERFGELNLFAMTIHGVPCFMRIEYNDVLLEDLNMVKDMKMLLLARDQSEYWQFYHFLVLKGSSSVVERQTMVTLWRKLGERDLVLDLDMGEEVLVLN